VRFVVRSSARAALVVASLPLPDDAAAALGSGESHSFTERPKPTVPRFGAGVYTIWHIDGRFIYVGMSGRGITQETATRNSPLGLYTRLASHASGRRSGDQFCVYVADRLVLQTLSQADIAAISSGEGLVRQNRDRCTTVCVWRDRNSK
jgi:hypothetical protein